MNNNENTGNQEIIQRLKTAESLWALVSGAPRNHMWSVTLKPLMMKS